MKDKWFFIMSFSDPIEFSIKSNHEKIIHRLFNYNNNHSNSRQL